MARAFLTDEKIFTLGKPVTGEVTVDRSATTLLKTVGMALFDVVVAQQIYLKAVDSGLGQKVNL